MTLFVRACGTAAAVLAFAAAVTFADPSIASETNVQQFGPNYLGHASAVIEGEGDQQSAAEAPAAATDVQDLSDHSVAAMTATMLETLNAAVPGEQSLQELVGAYGRHHAADAQQECLAGAVYFEARSEPLQGQLAVADVVLNRSRSGRYPTTICEVVTQRAQFSFIRNGRFPAADRSSQSWRKAVAIARIAQERLANEVAPNVLWYHADYVAPIWRRNLTRVTKIGAHIFYS